MDKKLEEYRTRKQREEFINNTKDKIKSFLLPKKKEDISQNEALLNSEYEIDEVVEDCDISENDKLDCCTFSDLMYYSLIFILWCLVFLIFIKLEFGLVYLVSSGLIGMYLNTGTKKKRAGEISAYSVFNKNCESIDGTLKAEQLERQMVYGRLL